jgi:hypothetical protein
MGVALRTYVVLSVLGSLSGMPQSFGEPAPTPGSAGKRHPTLCELRQNPSTYTKHFVVVSGRLVRRAGSLALVDDSCSADIVLLKEGSADVLGLTCTAAAPKSGLTCLIESTTARVLLTVSGIYSSGTADDVSTILVWEVSNVSVVPTT